MKKNLKLAMVVTAACIVILAGCTKGSTASIVGVWTFNTERELVKVNGTTTVDTTVNIAAGTTANFKADGHYLTAGAIGADTGTYVQANGKLTLTNTSNGSTTSLLVNNLSDHSMQLEMRDTGTSVPVQTTQYFYNLSR